MTLLKFSLSLFKIFTFIKMLIILFLFASFIFFLVFLLFKSTNHSIADKHSVFKTTCIEVQMTFALYYPALHI